MAKRKHTSGDDQQAPSAKTQQDIQAFGNIGKPSVSSQGLKKRKTQHQREETPPPAVKPTPVNADKKRKRNLETVEEESDVEHAQKPDAADGVSKHLSTPRNKRPKKLQPKSPAETPSKSTMALFEKMNLDVPSKAIPFSLNSGRNAYGTPPYTPEADASMPAQLPKELDDLRTMHAAFLSALSLYYAHNGTSSSVDVQALLPMITKNWKKRAVSLEDLQVLLAVGQDINSGFTLQDMGRAGVRLAISQPRGRATKRAASYVDELGLNSKFEDALQEKWTKWVAATSKENQNATLFIDQLPLADITRSESVDKTASLFGRGGQRLADLKASQAAAKPELAAAPVINAEHKTIDAVQNRGSSLLNRVLAKQTLASSLPAGPTRQQLERKAALHRVEDIARVLDLLAGGRPRCSFSMPAMIQHLQQSLRNPISKEEIERCLGLMATEITPGFVSLICSGTVMGVVVTKGGKIGLEELRQRVQTACV